MDMVKVKVNGIEVEVPANGTVLDAARVAGINIPTLCYLKDINKSGACRVCLVEVKRGRALLSACTTPVSEGIWLDTPMIDMIHGKGTLEKRLPGMLRMYMRYGIDMREVPIVIYPTLHYQNGGIKISANGMSDVENLFVAGEAVGGIHGRNRLMGNSLLDIIVFGRNAGQQASKKCKEVTVGELTLSHVDAFSKEMADAGIVTDVVSPKLLPEYRPEGVTRLN